jgi:long-chain-fatty-acid--CoA ligase ACSBG
MIIVIMIIKVSYPDCTYDAIDACAIIENPKNKKATIIDLLKQASERYPNAPALKIKEGKSWKDISYGEYYKKVKRFAQSLKYWLGSNVNVGILGFNSPGWVYSHLGTMYNGGISVGLYPSSTSESCSYIIKNTNIEMIVVEDAVQLEKLIGINDSPIKLIIYYSPINESIIEQFQIPVISMGNFMTQTNKLSKMPSQNDISTIIYTSGTTSDPKGVMISHKNIMTALRKTIELFKTKSSISTLGHEHFISYLPLNHIAAQMLDIYLPIACLSTVWFADKDALKSTLTNTIKEVRPTIFAGVPRVWEKIHEGIETKLSSIGWKGNLSKTFIPRKIIHEMGLERCKLCITTGAPVSNISRQYLSSIGCKLYDIYGMSETSGAISISGPNMSRVGSVGLPIMSVKIAKDGEILVKGDNLFVGYYEDPAETHKSFTKDKWFKTGDLGKLDVNGFLYVTGRKKELLITAGGENIAVAPIESALMEKLHTYCEYVIVIGDRKKFLSVLLVIKPKQKINDTIAMNAIEWANLKAPSQAHTVKKYAIITNKFKIGNELTPTYKLKREYIQNKYWKQIKKMYE